MNTDFVATKSFVKTTNINLKVAEQVKGRLLHLEMHLVLVWIKIDKNVFMEAKC